MSTVDLKETASNGHQKMLISEEQQAKINEVRRLIGPFSDKASIFCSDASISRYLKAQNWNVKKATQMLQRSLKWREEYKPEEIRWEEIADEAKTGKMYTANYCDKLGRTVIIMKPSLQNTNSAKGQIRYFVYCMEKAIFNLPTHQEEIVWLIDFHGYRLANISFKISCETAHILQEYYPERLGLGIMYNAPKIFQPFLRMLKPFLEPKTYNKFKFGYSNDHNTKKMLEDLFDMDHLGSAFGGNDDTGFEKNKYAERMKEEDKKMASFWTRANTTALIQDNATSLDSIRLDAGSDITKENIDCSQA